MIFNFYNISFKGKFNKEIDKFFKDFKVENFPPLDFDKLHSQVDFDIADEIKSKFKTLIVVGMGGAVLNPRMISVNGINNDKIIYLDTLDTEVIFKKLSKIDFSTTAVLSISKSGNTIETVSISSYLIEVFKKNNIDVSNHFYFITSENSYLYNLCIINKGKFIKHYLIGGRFSTYSNVSLIPAIFADFDFRKFIDFSYKILKKLDDKNELEYFYQSIEFLDYYKNIILFSFNHQIKQYNIWYSQILSESLGKEGFGITPIRAEGPLDHHSQLQLYLDGPKDKSFTLYNINKLKKTSESFEINSNIYNLQDILQIEYNSLLSELLKKGLPIREYKFDQFNEEQIAYLVIYSVLEIMLISNINGINPYTQPAIDNIKKHSFNNV